MKHKKVVVVQFYANNSCSLVLGPFDTESDASTAKQQAHKLYKGAVGVSVLSLLKWDFEKGSIAYE